MKLFSRAIFRLGEKRLHTVFQARIQDVGGVAAAVDK